MALKPGAAPSTELGRAQQHCATATHLPVPPHRAQQCSATRAALFSLKILLAAPDTAETFFPTLTDVQCLLLFFSVRTAIVLNVLSFPILSAALQIHDAHWVELCYGMPQNG